MTSKGKATPYERHPVAFGYQAQLDRFSSAADSSSAAGTSAREEFSRSISAGATSMLSDLQSYGIRTLFRPHIAPCDQRAYHQQPAVNL